MDHDDCDLRCGPGGPVLRRVRNQGPSSIGWALTILSAMEYTLARINPADNELSLQFIIYTLREYLIARKLIQDDARTWRGDYEVPMLEVFRWLMVHGVAKESECKSLAKVFLDSGMTVVYLQDYTVINVENEELMLNLLSDGFCLCATIQIFEDLKEYKHDENSVYEATAEDKEFVSHAVLITGFGTTPITRKKFWWIKNSWGEEWGDKGFGRIYRGFINRDGIDFSDAQGMQAIQEWDLAENLQGVLEYQTRYIKFQSVASITLHFPENFGCETTQIHYIGLKGEATQLKRDVVATIVYELMPNPSDHKARSESGGGLSHVE